MTSAAGSGTPNVAWRRVADQPIHASDSLEGFASGGVRRRADLRSWNGIRAPALARLSVQSGEEAAHAVGSRLGGPPRYDRGVLGSVVVHVPVSEGTHRDRVWAVRSSGRRRDPKNGGDLKLVERLHGELPESLMATTPSGGVHLYLAATPEEGSRNSQSASAKGIDTRGAGGFVVAPPSKGRRWINPGQPIAAAPERLGECCLWARVQPEGDGDD